MFYTDTHTHIHTKDMKDTAPNVMKRAYNTGVKRMLVIGVDSYDSLGAAELAGKYSGLYSSAGIHPHYADNFKAADLGAFEKILKNDKVIAVGESGLDYYRNRSSKENQINVFSLMIDVAVSAGLPLIIHARQAAHDIINTLDNVLGSEDHKILFHCFSGEDILINWGLARKNVMFSFAGNITYPKAVELHSALGKIPCERLFIETDCPYLAPVPLRGKPNEPAYIDYTAKFIAGKKNIEIENFKKILEDNFITFFGKKELLNPSEFGL